MHPENMSRVEDAELIKVSMKTLSVETFSLYCIGAIIYEFEK